MITTRIIRGRYTPLAVCDVCGEIIRDANMAASVEQMDRDEPDELPRVACKGRCHDALDAEIRAAGGLPGWQELGTWLARLLHNTGLKGEALDRAVRSSELMQRVG